jgi:DNA-binding transcriptional ArsR family regulator
MRVLGDPVRLEIVRLLSDGRLRTSGQIAEHVDLPSSTCSYHLKQLVTTGITEC